MAAFGCVELGLRDHGSYFFVHTGSRVAGNQRGRSLTGRTGDLMKITRNRSWPAGDRDRRNWCGAKKD
jgi:RNA-splicing ligase RtcB